MSGIAPINNGAYLELQPWLSRSGAARYGLWGNPLGRLLPIAAVRRPLPLRVDESPKRTSAWTMEHASTKDADDQFLPFVNHL